MPKLYYMIGAPRSGKSTFANKWVKEAPMRVIVSSDDIRMAMHGKRYEPLAETLVFATKHVMIRALLSRGFDVLVDGTHSTKISIQRILEIDNLATAIILDTPKETCVQRAIDTGKPDLVPVIERIYNNLLDLGWNTDDGHEELTKSLQNILIEIKKRNLYPSFPH